MGGSRVAEIGESETGMKRKERSDGGRSDGREGASERAALGVR